MYFWGIYFVWLLEGCLFSMFFSAVLEKRWKKINKLLIMLIVLLCSILPAYYKLKYSHNSNSYEYQISNTLQMAIFISSVIVFYKDKLWKKVLAYILMLVASVFASIMSQFVADSMNKTVDVMTWDLFSFGIYFIVFMGLIFFYALFILIWKKIDNYRFEIKNIFLLIIFLLAQFMCTYNMINITEKNIFNSDGLSCLVFMIEMVADLVLFYLLLNQGEKEYLETLIREKEQLRALEAVRFEELESKREAMAKFRHDYNNQLTTALLLEEQGNSEMAKEMIGRLRKQVTE